MVLTCNDNRLMPPDAAQALLTLALSLALSQGNPGIGLRLLAGPIRSPLLPLHEDFSSADEPSKLGGADHEGSVVGVVSQVEGSSQFGDFQVGAGVSRAGVSILGASTAGGRRGRSRLPQKRADVSAGRAHGVLAPVINDWLACARQSP